MKSKVAAGILISIAFLIWSFRDVNFGEFWESLRSAHYGYFILTVVLSLVLLVVRAVRWKYLLILQKDIAFLPVLSATSIGFFANNVLPFRAGEILRAYVIGRGEKISKSAALATIFVERIIDLLSLLFLALIAIFILPVPESEQFDTIKYLGLILFAVEGGVVLFCLMLLFKRGAALKITDLILNIFPQRICTRGKNIVHSFLDGLEIMKASRHFFLLAVTSLIIWIIALAQVYFLLVAFDITFDFQSMVTVSVVDMVLIGFALTIPSAPGFVGTFHAAAKEGLALFAVNASLATGFSVLLHAASYVPHTLTGFYFFLHENLKLTAAKSEFHEGHVHSPKEPHR